MPTADPTELARSRTAADLRAARRHADWVERSAWSLGAFGLLLGGLLTAVDLAFIGLGAGLAGVGLVTWGVLRALALALRLQADRAELDLIAHR